MSIVRSWTENRFGLPPVAHLIITHPPSFFSHYSFLRLSSRSIWDGSDLFNQPKACVYLLTKTIPRGPTSFLLFRLSESKLSFFPRLLSLLLKSEKWNMSFPKHGRWQIRIGFWEVWWCFVCFGNSTHYSRQPLCIDLKIIWIVMLLVGNACQLFSNFVEHYKFSKSTGLHHSYLIN